MNKTIKHPSLGIILYKKNKRSKRVTIRVRAEGQIHVTLPYQARYQQAVQVVEQHVPWIEAQLKKVVYQQTQRAITWESRLEVRGQPLRLQAHAKSRLQFLHTAQARLLLVPQHWKLEDATTQATLKDSLVEILRKLAKAYLPARTRYWAERHRISIANIRVKNVQSRWGSCSSKGNINLSLHLMLLPDAWIDYVICHELAHIAHPNHSAAFWNHLESHFPNAIKIDKALHQYRRPF